MRAQTVHRGAAALAAAALAAVVYATIVGAATSDTAPVSSSPPTISGTPQQGQALAATSGSWNGTTPMTFAYQWQRCNTLGSSCSAIGGASGQTYALQTADVGSTLRVQVTASNGTGSGQATSAQTAVVTAASATTAPQNTVAPQTSGTLTAGQTLTVSTGTWTGTQPITYTYEWQRCNAQGINCTLISGATSSSYTLVAADAGGRLQVLVTATNSAGSALKYSNQTGQVGGTASTPANTAAPVLTGTLAPGQTLTVSIGSWTGTQPITYSRQWQRCNSQGLACVPIAGAGGATYTLTQADVGARLQVLVTATNSAGPSSRYSNQTAPIGGAGTPSGGKTVEAASVFLPDRLIVDRMQYPSGGHSRMPFSARFHVSDTAGRSVAGALVYTLGLPYGWIGNVPEAFTDGQGWATFTLSPTAQMPRTGYLVMFVRARTPQGDILAGASTRRLVQVRVRP